MPRTGRGARTARGAVLAVFTMSIVATPAQAGRACDDATARAAQASTADLSDAVACLLNQERRRAGLRKVADNRRLEIAAARHARDMRERDYFDHTSLDGRSFSQRILETGYMRGQEVGPWKVGETLAWATDGISSPSQLVASLMASPPHREVILDGDYRDVGVGLVRGTPTADEDGVTLVVDFGTLKPASRGGGTPPPPSSPPPSSPPPPPAPQDKPDRDDRDREDDRGESRGNGRGKKEDGKKDEGKKDDDEQDDDKHDDD